MTIDELIARAKEASKNQCMSDLCRENFKQLAEWLEELKQYREQYKEQNQETNLDHFKQEILEACMRDLAVVKGKPKLCYKTNCNDCDFKINQMDCHKKVMDWLKQPRKAPAIKLTKFEIDLLQSFLKGHPLRYQFKNINALTEMRKKGYFKSVDMDAVLEDILENCEITEED